MCALSDSNDKEIGENIQNPIEDQKIFLLIQQERIEKIGKVGVIGLVPATSRTLRNNISLLKRQESLRILLG